MFNLDELAKQLVQMGAPLLGGIIKTTVPGPLGNIGGTLAEKALQSLGDALGTDATPEAVGAALGRPGAAEAVARVEAASPELIRVWEIETRRAAENDAAEREKGFTTWQVARTVIQGVVWLGWAILLVSAVFGGNLGIKGLVPLAEVLSAWVTVTMCWIAAFHGGHIVKEALTARAGGVGRR